MGNMGIQAHEDRQARGKDKSDRDEKRCTATKRDAKWRNISIYNTKESKGGGVGMLKSTNIEMEDNS